MGVFRFKADKSFSPKEENHVKWLIPFNMLYYYHLIVNTKKTFYTSFENKLIWKNLVLESFLMKTPILSVELTFEVNHL